MDAGGWRLEAGGLEAGGWKLEAGSWRLGSWRLQASEKHLGGIREVSGGSGGRGMPGAGLGGNYPYEVAHHFVGTCRGVYMEMGIDRGMCMRI